MDFERIFGIKFNLSDKNILKKLRSYSWAFIYSKYGKRLYREKIDFILNIDEYKRYNTILKQKLDLGWCICVLPASIGDTLLFFEYKKAIEDYFQIKCFPVVKNTHEIIPYLCGEKEYLSVENLYGRFNNIPIIKSYYINAESLQDIGNENFSIKKSSVFPLHWTFNEDGYKNSRTQQTESEVKNCGQWFLSECKNLYGIPQNSKMSGCLSLSRLSDLPDITNTIMLAPTASTAKLSNKLLWIEIAKKYKEKGYNVVYNSIHEIKLLNKYAKWLNCSLETAVKYAIKSEKVISVRSGICDLLHQLGERLTVIYSSQDFYNKFSLNEMFNRNDIKEVIYHKPHNSIINAI